jgi:hypothetical protein
MSQQTRAWLRLASLRAFILLGWAVMLTTQIPCRALGDTFLLRGTPAKEAPVPFYLQMK